MDHTEVKEGQIMASEIRIKEISAGSDVNLIEVLAKSIWTEHYTPIIGPGQVRYMLGKYQSAQRIRSDIANDGYIYYAAYCENTAAGYCAVRPDKKERKIFLSKLYVEKSYRGKGIARLFINEILKLAESNGCSSIWLTVNKRNTRSIEAYKKIGFSVTGDIVTDIGGGYVMDDYIIIDFHGIKLSLKFIVQDNHYNASKPRA